VNGPQLATALTAIRLSLHVLAATVWVGGQITVAGLLPTLRKLGEDAPRKAARALGRMQWPAYGLLLITGIWNVAADHVNKAGGTWKIVLAVKIAVVLVAGGAAFLHQRSKSKAGLAIGGAVTAIASVTALVLGVLLAG
jgi:putative copper export protein